MSASDVSTIISDLEKWAMGELASKLTWAVLEERFGFSRQSLQAKPSIKAAYDNAKRALSGGLVISKEQATKEVSELKIELERLKAELSVFREKEGLWLRRWQQIAFHIRQKGIQMQSVDKAPPDGAKLPSKTEAEKIIKMFDKEIPSSGRA